MSMKFLSKVSGSIVLQETGDKKTSWIQVFRKGEWKHPRYGNLKFTDATFEGFVKNFNDNVRQIDLAIDSDHKPEEGACGWIKQLEAREDGGLWALVEWTPRGVKLVSDGEYRYISGDFDYQWKNEETGKKYENVLFGAALTNRPFLKGLAPVNLSEYVDDVNLRDALQLAEDILKLKEGVVKTDAEIMACQDESTLTPEEMVRKQELMKIKEEEIALNAKKKLAEPKSDAEILKMDPEKMTPEEKKRYDELKTKKLAEVIPNENEQQVKRALAVGLSADATLEEIVKAEQAAITKQREMEKNVILADKASLIARAKAVGLPETATEAEVKKAEDEASAEKMLADVPSMEKRLSEMRESHGDALTIRLLAETLDARKKLAEEKLNSAKKDIEIKLKEHFKAGKMTGKERDTLQKLLNGDLERGCTSFKLSEKDVDGKEVEATKTLSEIIDGLLSDRPAVVELSEKAEKELREPSKEDDSKELSEEKVAEHAARVAARVTKQTKTSRRLAEEKQE